MWRTEHFHPLVYFLGSAVGYFSQKWAIKVWKVQSAAECGWELLSMRSLTQQRDVPEESKNDLGGFDPISCNRKEKGENSRLHLGCKCKSSLLSDRGGGWSGSVPSFFWNILHDIWSGWDVLLHSKIIWSLDLTPFSFLVSFKHLNINTFLLLFWSLLEELGEAQWSTQCYLVARATGTFAPQTCLESGSGVAVPGGQPFTV